MRDLKTSANRFMTDNRQWFPMFRGWGKSYCAITVSASRIPVIKSYIERQKEHHAKRSFDDEMRMICREYGIEIDERYWLKE